VYKNEVFTGTLSGGVSAKNGAKMMGEISLKFGGNFG
jgi:hypothetical protein